VGGDKGKGWLAISNFEGGKLSGGALQSSMGHCYLLGEFFYLKKT
jgi:hypothetical protein